MKKHIIYSLCVLLGATLVFQSCTKDGEEIVRILDAEKYDYILTPTQQSVNVSITANDAFTADWDGGPWGDVTVSEDKLVISVNENTGNTARYATVNVFLTNEKRTRTINVTQNGVNPLLDIFPDQFHFPLIGGTEKIQVSSDVDSWKVSSNASWITVEPYTKANEIVFHVDKNDVMETKTAKLTVGIGDVYKEIEVTIDPLTRYFIPYYDFNHTTAPSFVTNMREHFESPDLYCEYFGGDSAIYTFHWFATNSPIFPWVRSMVQFLRGNTAIEVSLLIDENLQYDYTVRNDMHDILMEDGFEFLFTSNTGGFYWKDLDTSTAFKLQCMVNITLEGDVHFISMTSNLKPQVNPEPTFDVLPTPSLGWGINKAAVESWEAANGGVLLEEYTNTLYYEVPSSNEFYQRWYIFEDSSLTNLLTIDVLYETSQLDLFFTATTQGRVINPLLYDKFDSSSDYEFIGYDINRMPAFYNASQDFAVAILGYSEAGVFKYPSFKYFKHTPKPQSKVKNVTLDDIMGTNGASDRITGLTPAVSE